MIKYNEYLSWSGNQNNPPDLIIKGGDAIEIKKMGGENNIMLNSSFPKKKLYRDSNLISHNCRECEGNTWVNKDICYVIGAVDNKTKIFKSIWFVYGDCYCADTNVYTIIKDKITEGISTLHLELSKTNEIARVNKVDPLGITDLRVRGMWQIKHPSKVFSYLQPNILPSIKMLMLKSKYDAFPSTFKQELEKLSNVKSVKIADPNNPANLLDAMFVDYQIQ